MADRKEPSSQRTLSKTLLYAILGLLSVAYLLNLGAGIFEILPDALPLVGNLDEAAMVFVLGAALEYFGLPIGSMLKKIGGKGT